MPKARFSAHRGTGGKRLRASGRVARIRGAVGASRQRQNLRVMKTLFGSSTYPANGPQYPKPKLS